MTSATSRVGEAGAHEVPGSVADSWCLAQGWNLPCGRTSRAPVAVVASQRAVELIASVGEVARAGTSNDH